MAALRLPRSSKIALDRLQRIRRQSTLDQYGPRGPRPAHPPKSVRLKHDLGPLFKEFDVTDAGLPPDSRYALSAFADMAKALKLKGGGGVA